MSEIAFVQQHQTLRRVGMRPSLTTHSAQQIEDVPVLQIAEETVEVAHHSTKAQHESLNRPLTWHPQVVVKIVKGSQNHAASCECA